MHRWSVGIAVSCFFGVGLPCALAEEKPIPSQLADLETAIRKPDAEVQARLLEAMTKKENEPLAQEVVRAARKLFQTLDKNTENLSFRGLLFLLAHRCGLDDYTRLYDKKRLIDGPYWKDYATLLLDIGEKHLDSQIDKGIGIDIRPLLIYLVAHPEEEKLRARTIKLARRYAKPADLPPRPDKESPAWARRARGQREFAWSVLFRLGVLRDGMRLAEAKVILGEPGQQGDDKEIRYSWGGLFGNLHRPAVLSAREVDGKLKFHWEDKLPLTADDIRHPDSEPDF